MSERMDMICPSLMKVGPRSVRMRRSFSGETPRVMACLWRTAVISFSLSLYVPVSLPFDFLPAVLFFSFLSCWISTSRFFLCAWSASDFIVLSFFVTPMSVPLTEKAGFGYSFSSSCLHKFLYFVLQCRSGFPAALLKQGNTISFSENVIAYS